MMAKLKVIVAVLAFVGILVLGTGLIAQQNTGGGVDLMKDVTPTDPGIRVLIGARLEAAKEVFETTMEPTRNGPLDDMPVWSRHWMEEQVRLDPSPVKRLAAIQDHLNRTKGLEAIAEARHQQARGSHADTLKMRYFRLEAEQMLAELRIINPGLFPPKPAAKP